LTSVVIAAAAQPDPVTTTSRIELRPYQRAAIAAVHTAYQRGVRRQLLVLPTGAGKTLVFGQLIAERGGRALVLAHRDELLRQAIDKLALVGIPRRAIGLVQADVDELGRQVQVASVQTLAQPRRLARLLSRGPFDTIVVDECHHAVSSSYRQILGELGAIALPAHHLSRPRRASDQLHLLGDVHPRPPSTADGALLLGVTATPDRGDRVGLGTIFDEIVYEVGLVELIRQDYLVDLRAKRIVLAGADFSSLHVRAGDVIPGEVERVFHQVDAPRQVARAYLEHAEGRRSLVFTPGVRTAYETAAALRDLGVAAEAIDGSLELDERRALLERFSSGQTQVLVNCQLLGEGFDEPRIEAVLIARPTRSRALYQQLVGRGTRPYPGKTNLLVLDLVGASERHDLVSVASLFGLEPRELRKRSVREVLDERLADDRPAFELPDGQLVATPVELFRRHHLAWVEVDPNEFLLSLGGPRGDLLIQRTPGDRWRVFHLWPNTRPQVLASDLDLGYAQGVGEAEARRLGADALIERMAPWREEPASDAQLRKLRQLSVTPSDGLTKGEAAEQISVALARLRHRQSNTHRKGS
jgi:ATP-dependent helicase IRC3